MVTVPLPPEPMSSSTASIATFAAGVSSALPNANSTSLGSLITVFFVPPASSGPTRVHVTGSGAGPPRPGERSTGSSTRAGEPAGWTGTCTGCSPSMITASSVVSAGGAVNMAVTVVVPPGGTVSPLLSLSRPPGPSVSRIR